MGHNSGQREAEWREREQREAHDRERVTDAIAVVKQWNVRLAAGKPAHWSPTIGAAILARKPWLRLYCPGCRQQHELDLRRVVRPREFPITALLLTCESGCRGQSPRPVLLGLVSVPYDRKRLTWEDSA
jgi:hypothetical protein